MICFLCGKTEIFEGSVADRLYNLKSYKMLSECSPGPFHEGRMLDLLIFTRILVLSMLY